MTFSFNSSWVVVKPRSAKLDRNDPNFLEIPSFLNDLVHLDGSLFKFRHSDRKYSRPIPPMLLGFHLQVRVDEGTILMAHNMVLPKHFRDKQTVICHRMIDCWRVYEKFTTDSLRMQQHRGVRHLQTRVPLLVPILNGYPQTIFKQLKLTVVGAHPHHTTLRKRLENMVPFGNTPRQSYFLIENMRFIF